VTAKPRPGTKSEKVSTRGAKKANYKNLYTVSAHAKRHTTAWRVWVKQADGIRSTQLER
jgi:hypothetical protein